MQFDRTIVAECVIPPAVVVDPRCSDSAFAIANPSICSSALIIKPAVAFLCVGESVTFRVFEYAGGIEQEVIGATFASSDSDIFSIGTTSGSGVVTQAGLVIITATYNSRTVSAQVTALPVPGCCDDVRVVTSIIVDNSVSSTLNFGGIYATRLVFAKAVASLYGSLVLQVDGQPKDGLKAWTISDVSTALTEFTGISDEILAAIDGIGQLQTKTNLLPVFTTIATSLLAEPADRRIILLISDGEHTVNEDRQAVINAAKVFKDSGGVIIAIGLRASGEGYDLLQRVATGGFLLNATASNADDVLAGLNYLKKILCAGDCFAEGDVYVPTPELNYSSFLKWEVASGIANLLGPGLRDLLPGNGLYVELAYPNSTARSIIKTIDQFDLKDGRTYRISLKVAGNQLNNISVAPPLVYLREVGANDSDPNIFESGLGVTWNQDFQQHQLSFIAGRDSTVRLYLSHQPDGENSGVLFDEIVLEDVSTATKLLEDDFDNENLIYIPPRCGPGTYFVSGNADLIPTMTSNTTPTGVVFASAEEEDVDFPGSGPAWRAVDGHSDTSWATTGYGNDYWGYEFETGRVVTGYQVSARHALNTVGNLFQPGEWLFQGSSETIGGIVTPETMDWVTLDSQPELSWDIGETKTFAFANTVAYRSYRFLLQSAPNGSIAFARVQFTGEGTPDYGYVTGFNCYDTYNCLDESGIAQLSDSSPLPDIERDYVPPTVFTSTKQVCKSCPAGYVNVSTVNLVPLMTSNTAPSGVASASNEGFSSYEAFKAFDQNDSTSWRSAIAAPVTLGYQFTTAKTVAVYALTAKKIVGGAISHWTLEGSNNGTSWTALDTRNGITWFDGERKLFQVDTPGSYLHYRLNMPDSPGAANDHAAIIAFEMFAVAPAQVCKSATRTSLVSQGNADLLATEAATTLANNELHCVQEFTSTQTAFAECPNGQYGDRVTKSSTAKSLVSKREADAEALAEAQAAANEELDCEQSNNTQRITINDRTGSGPAAATPYPSVKYVSGVIGSITKVTVKLNRWNHGNFADVHILLRSPSGRLCLLAANAMDAAFNTFDCIFILDDDAADPLPQLGRPTGPDITVTYQPTVYDVQLEFPAPAPGFPAGPDSYPTTLAEFIGDNPNGSWSLWIMDDTTLDTGYILQGFDLTLTTA